MAMTYFLFSERSPWACGFLSVAVRVVADGDEEVHQSSGVWAPAFAQPKPGGRCDRRFLLISWFYYKTCLHL